MTRPSPRRARALLVAAAASALALGVPATWAAARPSAAPAGLVVRYVDDDAGCDGQRPCYDHLQAAVDAADDGDVVSVAPGTYTETVSVIDKALAFEGPGAGDPLEQIGPAQRERAAPAERST